MVWVMGSLTETLTRLCNLRLISTVFTLLLIACSTKSNRPEARFEGLKKQLDGTPETDSTVYVFGSIHGNMLDQPKNSLRDFVAFIIAFKPHMILSEVRPEVPGGIEGSIDGGPEQAIVYAYAKYAAIPVIPVDWFDDHYNKELAREETEMAQTLKDKIEPLFKKFTSIVRTGTLADSQSQETQALIQQRYELIKKEGLQAFETRNLAICKNIESQIPQFHHKRVLIVFGLAHKYFIENCLRQNGIEALQFSNLDSSGRPITAIPKDLKSEAALNFKAAKKLLGHRLRIGFYRSNIPELQDKLKEFDRWIKQTSELY